MSFKGRLILLFVLTTFIAHSQYFMSRNNWKKQRKEIFFGGGVGNFLGDLGGKDRIGTDYSYADLEMSLTRPSATVGFRYRLAKNWAIRTDFNYMRLWGKDALTQEMYRHNRNLSFRTNIFELSTNIEYAFFREKGGNRYGIKRTFVRRYKQKSSYFYVSLGVGAFWFNPKAQYGGNWYALQPLSTEGEGLPGGPKRYKRVSVSIPIAFGYRMSVGKHWTLGIEYNFRKTFTDYIDDVSTTYYDKNALLMAKGPIAVALADPSLGEVAGATSPNGDGTGAQRGDKQKDSFLALEMKIGYFLKDKRRKKATRAKF